MSLPSEKNAVQCQCPAPDCCCSGFSEHGAEFNDAISRYLLGELSLQERSWLEQKFFANDEFFEEMLAVESEIIDAYQSQHLSPADRAAFDTRFSSSPALPQRLAFSASLKAVLKDVAKDAAVEPVITMPVAKTFWLRRLMPVLPHLLPKYNLPVWALNIGAMLLLAAGVAGNFYLMRNLQQRFDQARQVPVTPVSEVSSPTIAKLQSEELPAPSASRISVHTAPSPKSQRKITNSSIERGSQASAEMTLIPGLLRSNGLSNRLVRDTNATFIRLHFSLAKADYPRYQIMVQTVEGKTVYTSPLCKAGLTKGGARVSVQVPSSLLVSDDYQISLYGCQDEGMEVTEEYFLKVREVSRFENGRLQQP